MRVDLNRKAQFQLPKQLSVSVRMRLTGLFCHVVAVPQVRGSLCRETVRAAEHPAPERPQKASKSSRSHYYLQEH